MGAWKKVPRKKHPALGKLEVDLLNEIPRYLHTLEVAAWEYHDALNAVDDLVSQTLDYLDEGIEDAAEAIPAEVWHLFDYIRHTYPTAFHSIGPAGIGCTVATINEHIDALRPLFPHSKGLKK